MAIFDALTIEDLMNRFQIFEKLKEINAILLEMKNTLINATNERDTKIKYIRLVEGKINNLYKNMPVKSENETLILIRKTVVSAFEQKGLIPTLMTQNDFYIELDKNDKNQIKLITLRLIEKKSIDKK